MELTAKTKFIKKLFLSDTEPPLENRLS